jgi:hypothetical protein
MSKHRGRQFEANFIANEAEAAFRRRDPALQRPGGHAQALHDKVEIVATLGQAVSNRGFNSVAYVSGAGRPCQQIFGVSRQ